MSLNGSPVVLVNRTQRVLMFVADGQHHQLAPGENYGFNSAQVYFAKAQNPQMGSEDYHTLEYTSLVGVKGAEGDDCSPIDESEDLGSNGERFNYASLPDGGKGRVKIAARHQPIRGRIAGIAGAESMAVGG
jgi:hypothetical protein